MATHSRSSRRTAARSRPPPGGPRRPSWCRPAARGPSSSQVESRTGAPALGSGGLSVAFAPGLSPAPVAAFPVPAHRTRRADFRHRALQWDHAPRTRTTGTKVGTGPVIGRQCGATIWVRQHVISSCLSRRTSCSGSSPRARGTAQHRVRRRSDRRFIPASAGNRADKRADAPPGAVHPRERGEQSAILSTNSSCSGSSPRARGTVGHARDFVHHVRFIPASAGNRCPTS